MLWNKGLRSIYLCATAVTAPNAATDIDCNTTFCDVSYCIHTYTCLHFAILMKYYQLLKLYFIMPNVNGIFCVKM